MIVRLIQIKVVENCLYEVPVESESRKSVNTMSKERSSVVVANQNRKVFTCDFLLLITYFNNLLSTRDAVDVLVITF